MFLAVGVLWTLALASAQQLNLVHEWNLVNYNTPRGYPGQEFFLANRTIITSTEVGFDRQFFAIPKIWSDNPATLVSIPKNSAEKGPIFEVSSYSLEWYVVCRDVLQLLQAARCNSFCWQMEFYSPRNSNDFSGGPYTIRKNYPICILSIIILSQRLSENHQ